MIVNAVSMPNSAKKASNPMIQDNIRRKIEDLVEGQREMGVTRMEDTLRRINWVAKLATPGFRLGTIPEEPFITGP